MTRWIVVAGIAIGMAGLAPAARAGGDAYRTVAAHRSSETFHEQRLHDVVELRRSGAGKLQLRFSRWSGKGRLSTSTPKVLAQAKLGRQTVLVLGDSAMLPTNPAVFSVDGSGTLRTLDSEVYLSEGASRIAARTPDLRLRLRGTQRDGAALPGTPQDLRLFAGAEAPRAYKLYVGEGRLQRAVELASSSTMKLQKLGKDGAFEIIPGTTTQLR